MDTSQFLMQSRAKYGGSTPLSDLTHSPQMKQKKHLSHGDPLSTSLPGSFPDVVVPFKGTVIIGFFLMEYELSKTRESEGLVPHCPDHSPALSEQHEEGSPGDGSQVELRVQIISFVNNGVHGNMSKDV
ncbi:hypothetical protein BTVI_107705 [Pitangus sulphuratus]|nr:hypothetical protein BTVI_107705 [Pitangus sulphuratus]